MNRARLLVFNAALGPLDYRVPEGMAVEPGSVVIAPLGPRQILGIVWEPERLPASEVPDARLRPDDRADRAAGGAAGDGERPGRHGRD